MTEEHLFADAEAAYEEARFIILGVPFDKSSSFRAGSAEAPSQIREASYNFEEYQMEYGFNIKNAAIYDAGNLGGLDSTNGTVDKVKKTVATYLADDKFPILLGGEHTLTIGAVQALREKGDLCLVSIDAHLDFRQQYLEDSNSHACVTRRASDCIGLENIIVVGVRSISNDEMEEDELPFYISGLDVAEEGMEHAIQRLLIHLKEDRVYLTIDMDGIDPAYAPGVGTPEPFGLTPLDVKKIIDALASRLVGMDVTEVCPPHDNGNTSALAARLVRLAIAAVETKG
jgi:agmatinase